MDKQPERIRIESTDDRAKQTKPVSAQPEPALELGVQELEERIAPTSISVTYYPQKPDGSL